MDLLVQFLHIPSGSIPIACDRESALNKIFSYLTILNINDPCYDLIFMAQQLWRKSPLQWKTHQVKGHQDMLTSVENLDIYARLNVEMDTTTKLFMQMAKSSSHHFTTIQEP
jgi:hypothetical protein